ncbi:Pr6Pr family membrane protein [soil metagenome]
MSVPSVPARLFAAFVSLIAVTGLVVQFSANASHEPDVLATLWILLRFFTIWTNLFCAVVFGALALGRTAIATPSRLGCATLAILLVGIVYALLLAGLKHLVGAAVIADVFLHKITPVLVPLGWLVAAPKGGLTRRDPWLWALFPLGYLAYALVRGAEEHLFAYPFLDFVKHGWLHVVIHAVVMAAGFLLAGEGLLRLDRRLVRSSA